MKKQNKKDKILEAEIIRPRTIYEWDKIIIVTIWGMFINLLCGIGILLNVSLNLWAGILISINIIVSLFILLFTIYALLNPKLVKEKEIIPIKLK